MCCCHGVHRKQRTTNYVFACWASHVGELCITASARWLHAFHGQALQFSCSFPYAWFRVRARRKSIPPLSTSGSQQRGLRLLMWSRGSPGDATRSTLRLFQDISSSLPFCTPAQFTTVLLYSARCPTCGV